MTTYNTGNEIGSADPRDLFDNSQNFDEFVNSVIHKTFPDRLGRERLTWCGMVDRFNEAQQQRMEEFQAEQKERNAQFTQAQEEREDQFTQAQEEREDRFNQFIISSGYEYIGDYGPNVTFTEYNQIVRGPDGDFWRVSGGTDLPYTTTGAGIPEDGALVNVSDAVLRQELDADGGVARVRNARAVVETLDDLKNAPWIQTGMTVEIEGREESGDGGWNIYDIVPSGSGVDDGGSYIDLPGSNTQARGLFPNGINVKQFGAFDDPQAWSSPGPGSATFDQFPFFNAAANYAVNSTIDVPPGRYHVKQKTTQDAYWILAAGATVSGANTARVGGYRDLSNLSGTVSQWVNNPQGGDGSPFSGGANSRIGDPEPYESNIIGHATTAAGGFVGRNGGSAITAAARNSTDNSPPGTQKQQSAVAMYGLQDNTENLNHTMTAAYAEVTKAPNTSRAIALEVTIKNFDGDSPDITAVSSLGQTTSAATGISLHTSVGPLDGGAGSVDTSGWENPVPGRGSYAIGVIGRPDELDRVPGWQKGIIFFNGSITGKDQAAINMFRSYQTLWTSEGGIAEGRSGNGFRRFVFGNDNTPENTSENVFWRYRGAPLAKGRTQNGDVLGRHSFHGHKPNSDTAGFGAGATPAIVKLEAIQDGDIAVENTSGKYSVRVNDGTGGFTGFDFVGAALRPTGNGSMSIGTAANNVDTVHATEVLVGGSQVLRENQDTGWIDATLQNGWSAFSTVQYRRLPTRLILIRGRLDNSAATDNLVFVLPEGFRPGAASAFIVPLGVGSSATPDIASISIAANGAISVNTAIQNANLTSIQFKSDQ